MLGIKKYKKIKSKLDILLERKHVLQNEYDESLVYLRKYKKHLRITNKLIIDKSYEFLTLNELTDYVIDLNQLISNIKINNIELINLIKSNKVEIKSLRDKLSQLSDNKQFDKILLDVMNLGMEVRQNQLNGHCTKSGSELLDAWKKDNL